jgi:hypothetical protein
MSEMHQGSAQPALRLVGRVLQDLFQQRYDLVVRKSRRVPADHGLASVSDTPDFSTQERKGTR